MKYDIKTGKTKQSNITSIIFKQTSQILQQYFDNNINLEEWHGMLHKTHRISALFKLRIETPGGAFVRTSGSRRSDCTLVRSRWLKSMMNAEVSRMVLCPIQCYSDAQYLL